MKRKLKYILLFISFSFSLSCLGTIPKTKEDCLSQSTTSSRCCYNADTKSCLSLYSNSLYKYYDLLKKERTQNIDCGFNAADEIKFCERIIPYPTSNSTACYEYDMIIPDVGIDGSTRSYRCCLKYDEYFSHHCESTLMGETDYEITVLKRGAVSGKHYYCKNNNYDDTLLQCAYSKSVGPGYCSKNKINSKDAFYYDGYTYDRCCYVAYDFYEACAPFPSDDDYVNEYMENKKKEGYSFIVKCGGNDDNNYDSTKSEELGTEVTVNQCESIHPRTIKDCTKHTILNSEIKNIQGYNYDRCCFYEVGNGVNSCVVLPNNEDFLNNLKENSKIGKKLKINLVDCKSNYILKNVFNLFLIMLLILY